jgi:hypothetical protein
MSDFFPSFFPEVAIARVTVCVCFLLFVVIDGMKLIALESRRFSALKVPLTMITIR